MVSGMLFYSGLLRNCNYLILFIVGMGKELENLILENTELLETKWVVTHCLVVELKFQSAAYYLLNNKNHVIFSCLNNRNPCDIFLLSTNLEISMTKNRWHLKLDLCVYSVYYIMVLQYIKLTLKSGAKLCLVWK